MPLPEQKNASDERLGLMRRSTIDGSLTPGGTVEKDFSIVTQEMVDYYRALALRSSYLLRRYYTKLANGMQKGVQKQREKPEEPAQQPTITRKAA
jgi:hypothetical protein